MLIQSRDEKVYCPGLFRNWKEGTIQGLCTRGGYEVIMLWKDGKLQSVQI